jgi:hypothetical protein
MITDLGRAEAVGMWTRFKIPAFVVMPLRPVRPAAAESLSTSREMIAAGFLNSKDPKTVEKGSILATMGQRGGSTFGHRSSAPV